MDKLRLESSEVETVLTAYHEAGHVVIGILNYMAVSGAVLSDNKKYCGATQVQAYQPVSDTPENIRNALLSANMYMLLAGSLAEREASNYFDFDDVEYELLSGGTDDNDRVNDFINRFNLAEKGKARKELKQQLKNNVSQFIQTHWKEVVSIATALMERGFLNFDDISECLLMIPGKEQFWLNRLTFISNLLKDADGLRIAS